MPAGRLVSFDGKKLQDGRPPQMSGLSGESTFLHPNSVSLNPLALLASDCGAKILEFTPCGSPTKIVGLRVDFRRPTPRRTKNKPYETLDRHKRVADAKTFDGFPTAFYGWPLLAEEG
jgi:hypothetical protein